MKTPNIPLNAVNAWIYLDEDDPKGTGYQSPNSSYQSLVNNNVYQYTDMLFVCFFSVIPDGKGYYTIDIGNATKVHPGGLTTAQYLQNVINDSRKQNSGIQILATLNYNNTTLSQIFSGPASQWQAQCNAFAANLVGYLSSMNMNGLDIDWEGFFSQSITSNQFAMLFAAIRTAFNTQSAYYYLTLSPASVGTLDANTVNTCFDFLNLQLYSGFTFTQDYLNAGISPAMLGYGAQFEQGIGNTQNADQAYASYLAGFDNNGTNCSFPLITQWRLNSNNYPYEQSQQILLSQFVHNVQGSNFDDTALVSLNNNQPITALSINSGEVLDAIQATNGSGATQLALLQHGGNDGHASQVNLNSGDIITEISGFTGDWFGRNCLVQITLTTKAGVKYGPFGTMSNVSSQAPFSYVAPSGQSLLAFKGSTVLITQADGTLSFIIASLAVSFG
jgi:Glycosyl hydrolases family 18